MKIQFQVNARNPINEAVEGLDHVTGLVDMFLKYCTYGGVMTLELDTSTGKLEVLER